MEDPGRAPGTPTPSPVEILSFLCSFYVDFQKYTGVGILTGKTCIQSLAKSLNIFLHISILLNSSNLDENYEKTGLGNLVKNFNSEN